MKNTMEKFWKKWIKADSIEREKLLKPVVEFIMEADSMPEKLRKSALATGLNTYFEDLYYVIADEERNVRKNKLR